MKEAFPEVTRVAYLHELDYYSPAQNERAKDAVRLAAQARGIRFEVLELLSLDDVDLALSKILAGRPGAIMVIGGPISTPARKKIAAFAASRRLPAIYGDALFVQAGELMFYGTPLR